MHRFFLFFLTLFIIPTVVSADVLITEIAWMGTNVSSSNEWIEIYNNGQEDVDLEGWTILWDTNLEPPKIIDLSGDIKAQNFFILERTDDSTLPSIVADIIYVGALSNSGEKLILKDNSGEIVHIVDNKDGWQAGDNTTKETMQWNGESWVTGVPLPRNIVMDDKNIIDNDDVSENNTQTQEEISVHISPVPISDIENVNNFYVSAGRDRVGTTGTPILFEGFLFDENNLRVNDGAYYRWSFGDGSVNLSSGMISHSYKYPGEYIVVLNAGFRGKDAVSKINVRVMEPKLSIREINASEKNSYVGIRNDTDYDMNLYGWQINDGLKGFLFPKDTIIKANREIIFPNDITSIIPKIGSSIILSNGLHVIEKIVSADDMVNDAEIRELANGINKVRDKIAHLSNNVNAIEKKTEVQIENSIINKIQTEEREVVYPQTAYLMEVEKKNSFWGNLILSLGKLFNF